MCELQTFWHSSSHILGQALELEFGVDLTIGPAIEEGFYYDCYLEDGRTLTDSDKAAIEKRMQQVRIHTSHTLMRLRHSLHCFLITDSLSACSTSAQAMTQESCLHAKLSVL